MDIEPVTICSPKDVETGRIIVRNNARIECSLFQILTNQTWLPHVLVAAGFFPSGSEIKKNRRDLWRDLEKPTDFVKLKWAEISILFVEDLDPEAELKWIGV